MSSISITRQHIQNTTNWPLYREHRAHLADLFPVVRHSGQPKVPLCHGIKYDLIGANTGISAEGIKHFLRAYTFGPKYLRALKAGARRFDLWGNSVGVVSEDEAAHAALSLGVHYGMCRASRAGLKAVRRALEDYSADSYLEAAE